MRSHRSDLACAGNDGKSVIISVNGANLGEALRGHRGTESPDSAGLLPGLFR